MRIWARHTVRSLTTEPGYIPCRDVESRLGLPGGTLSKMPDHYRVSIRLDWAGQPIVSIAEAAALVEREETKFEQTRRAKAANDAKVAAQRSNADKRDEERRQRTYDLAISEGQSPYFALARVAKVHDGAGTDR